jgi:transcriptional regulator of acetoin/glycerol metabolism
MDRVLAAWRRFREGLRPESCLRSGIVESWERSRAAGVDPESERLNLNQVADDDLQRRLEANADLLAMAKPHLEWASSMTARRPSKWCRPSDRR